MRGPGEAMGVRMGWDEPNGQAEGSPEGGV